MTASLKASKAKLLATPPRTAMEVYELLPENTRSEVIDNTLFMPPTPSAEHQDVSADLLTDIRVYTRKNNIGKCFVAPISVYLDAETVVEPDVVFIKSERLNIIVQGKIQGVPDLLIEILSPGNRKHDLETKLHLYERFGVPEYMIIDPLTKTVLHYILENNAYRPLPSGNGTFHSVILQAGFYF